MVVIISFKLCNFFFFKSAVKDANEPEASGLATHATEDIRSESRKEAKEELKTESCIQYLHENEKVNNETDLDASTSKQVTICESRVHGEIEINESQSESVQSEDLIKNADYAINTTTEKESNANTLAVNESSKNNEIISNNQSEDDKDSKFQVNQLIVDSNTNETEPINSVKTEATNKFEYEAQNNNHICNDVDSDSKSMKTEEETKVSQPSLEINNSNNSLILQTDLESFQMAIEIETKTNDQSEINAHVAKDSDNQISVTDSVSTSQNNESISGANNLSVHDLNENILKSDAHVYLEIKSDTNLERLAVEKEENILKNQKEILKTEENIELNIETRNEKENQINFTELLSKNEQETQPIIESIVCNEEQEKFNIAMRRYENALAAKLSKSFPFRALSQIELYKNVNFMAVDRIKGNIYRDLYI